MSKMWVLIAIIFCFCSGCVLRSQTAVGTATKPKPTTTAPKSGSVMFSVGGTTITLSVEIGSGETSIEPQRLAEELEELKLQCQAEEHKLKAQRQSEELKLQAERQAEELKLEAQRQSEELKLQAEMWVQRQTEELKLQAERQAAELELQALRIKCIFSGVVIIGFAFSWRLILMVWRQLPYL